MGALSEERHLWALLLSLLKEGDDFRRLSLWRLHLFVCDIMCRFPSLTS